MIPFFLNGKTYQIPYEVNDAITALLQDNDKLRTELKTAAAILNKVRANIESTLYPNSGFAVNNRGTQ